VSGRRRRLPGSEAGAIVVGWFARIAITLALIGLLAFDGISIGLAHAHVDDVAGQAADAAAAAYAQHPNIHAALSAAISAAGAQGATIAADGLVVTRSGRTTTLRVTVDLVPGTTLLGHLPGTGSLNQTSAVAVRTVNL
jgi:hypothetical protein